MSDSYPIADTETFDTLPVKTREDIRGMLSVFWTVDHAPHGTRTAAWAAAIGAANQLRRAAGRPPFKRQTLYTRRKANHFSGWASCDRLWKASAFRGSMRRTSSSCLTAPAVSPCRPSTADRLMRASTMPGSSATACSSSLRAWSRSPACRWATPSPARKEALPGSSRSACSYALTAARGRPALRRTPPRRAGQLGLSGRIFMSSVYACSASS